MKIVTTFAFLLVAACGDESTPAPAPTTIEECEAAGYRVVGDIGDGQVECPDGQEEVSRLEYGIEGGVCCKPPVAE